MLNEMPNQFVVLIINLFECGTPYSNKLLIKATASCEISIVQPWGIFGWKITILNCQLKFFHSQYFQCNDKKHVRILCSQTHITENTCVLTKLLDNQNM